MRLGNPHTRAFFPARQELVGTQKACRASKNALPGRNDDQGYSRKKGGSILKADQDHWNRKYQSGDFPKNPSKIVQQFYRQATPGRALDIAAGTGRNTIFLAERGFQVEALDISDKALSGFEKYSNVIPVCVDFDTYNIPMNRYSLILNIRFLHRRLFPLIIEGLIDGGVLIFETYLIGNDPASQSRHRREFMLRPNELIHSFLPLRIIHYQEMVSGYSEEDRPIASLVAVKGQGAG
jgi:tellurite methyltransferase